VLVLGAGISGLSCAYELMRRGHNVTVLEGSGRAGGHVRTSDDPFADGLYADFGAEQFYFTRRPLARSLGNRLRKNLNRPLLGGQLALGRLPPQRMDHHLVAFCFIFRSNRRT